MPRLRPPHSPPLNSRKRRLPSYSDPAYAQSEDHSPLHQPAKRARVSGSRERNNSHFQEDEAPMTDPVLSGTRSVQTSLRAVAPLLVPTRKPTNENKPPVPHVPKPNTYAPIAASSSAAAPALGSPFQHVSRTNSASAATYYHGLSPFTSSLENAIHLARTRATSLRPHPYSTALRAHHASTAVPNVAGLAPSLMRTLLTTPLATSTPRKSGQDAMPSHHGAMDLDPPTLRGSMQSDEESAESVVVPPPKDKGKGRLVVGAQGRPTERRSSVDERAKNLSSLFSHMDLDGEDRQPAPPASSSSDRTRKFTHPFASKAKQSAKDSKKAAGSSKMKTMTVGQGPPSIKALYKKENADASKQKTPRHPFIMPLQLKKKPAKMIPIVVKDPPKPPVRQTNTTVAKAFVQKHRETVWMKVADDALAVSDDDSKDEIDAF
ncbi:hypothetical protein DACRYDRAFT_105812 [Dacryopinax primogenitus]|uniref:Uncharacterized protein n=1 Tax=Dacryopinax primogenitus (strain DJM 731) TaxID=1858805 RepID=M5G4N2_DACPD|nr:uncharacterized protein DACRYDRAFT_105812 [Dacryopinax primogenitus]EJU03649.1 hypothetical protein DACRYDRAFT_105812 [Dacryopinax primogenitus]